MKLALHKVPTKCSSKFNFQLPQPSCFKMAAIRNFKFKYLWADLYETRYKYILYQKLNEVRCSASTAIFIENSSLWKIFNLNKKLMFINWFGRDSMYTQFLIRSRPNFDDQLRPPSFFNDTFFEILNLKKTLIY